VQLWSKQFLLLIFLRTNGQIVAKTQFLVSIEEFSSGIHQSPPLLDGSRHQCFKFKIAQPCRTANTVVTIIIIFIINEIYRAQNSQGQQMRQVSCCMIQLS